MLISLILLVFVSAVVAQGPPTGVPVYIKDFKGSVFDLAFNSRADLAPVQTLNQKPSDPAQKWFIQPVGSLFNITNPSAPTVLSFTTATNGVNPTCAQICGHPTAQNLWNVTTRL
ncbi:hypothetical protein DFH09DRAFT_1127474 [Mycena vulgaris]|nr:hypothetical protein DFH09DRAFT_1127474 [Mycena vulgaris]